MEITPDHSKLASARLSADKLQSLFETLLTIVASVDCETVVDPKILHAEVGEGLAANLAVARQIGHEMEETYRVALADYLRFCRLYIGESGEGFDKSVYKSLASAIRRAYKKEQEFVGRG